MAFLGFPPTQSTRNLTLRGVPPATSLCWLLDFLVLTCSVCCLHDWSLFCRLGGTTWKTMILLESDFSRRIGGRLTQPKKGYPRKRHAPGLGVHMHQSKPPRPFLSLPKAGGWFEEKQTLRTWLHLPEKEFALTRCRGTASCLGQLPGSGGICLPTNNCFLQLPESGNARVHRQIDEEPRKTSLEAFPI